MDCKTCQYRKDLNKIIPWADPSNMFTNWKCFYNLKDDFESVLSIYDQNEGKSIPDLRYDLYHHKWIQMNFICPLALNTMKFI